MVRPCEENERGAHSEKNARCGNTREKKKRAAQPKMERRMQERHDRGGSERGQDNKQGSMEEYHHHQYQCIIQPRLDYAITLWGFTSQLNLSRVQRLQNRAARIITGNFDYFNVRGIDIVKRLQWMNVIERRDYFVALTVFKCIHGMAPTYISDCITICNEVAVRDTRNSTSANLLTLPYASLDIFKNSFAYRGPFIWNDLPHDIRKCATLSCFKTALKAHILNV